MRQNGHVEMIGTSHAVADLKAEIERVARSDAKVLITGETGVGKEVVARAINAASARAQLAYVAVNCAGIPETLLESELFGHVKGSFTGAYRDKPGKLEMANNGTIFLDEIGEMTLRMQGLLLRFLETGEIQKVGAERLGAASNVRVIAATNRNLRDLISQGQFREDLFYRLNVIHLVVPPLRERREDIAPLVEHFLRRYMNGNGNGNGSGNGNGNGNGDTNGDQSIVRAIAPETVAVLREYSWPGNVRELENMVERLAILCEDSMIDTSILPENLVASARPATPPMAVKLKEGGLNLNNLVRELEGRLINDALKQSGGNKQAAARLLGLKRTTFSAKLRRCGVIAPASLDESDEG